MNIFEMGPAFVALSIGLPALVVFAIVGIVLDLTQRRRLRRAVFSNLDSAYANGYFEPGEYMYKATPQSVTFDLRAFASDMFEHSADKLLPHVQAWLDQKGL